MPWIVSVIALVVFWAASAQAQNYPTKPIHILVPYAPGGITDIAARILGAKLTEAWGQQVVVENKPGGNGFIAMTAGAKAAPDGYTLIMATVGDVAINPALFKEMPYDVQRDLAPIAMVSDAPMVLAAQRQRALHVGRRGHRRRQGAAGAALGRYPRQRQRQSDRARMDGAQYRHPVPAHPLQGRGAGRGRAGRGRYSPRRAGELFRRPARQVRPRPRRWR